jgi:probable HAF family extracellular repeat protein
LWQDGAFTPIDVPDARRTQPFGINNRGQIVGEYADAEGRSHGFLLDNGVFTAIDVPDSASTVATDIDDSGRIVGYSTDAAGAFHGFLRDTGGGFTSIDVSGAAQTQVSAINNRGQSIGIYMAPHPICQELWVTHSPVGEGARARFGYGGTNTEGDIHDPYASKKTGAKATSGTPVR